MTPWPRHLAILLLLGTSACGEPMPSAASLSLVQRIELPDTMREVSGLAAVAQDKLIAVTDELATVYAIDLGTGSVEVLFSLGDPIIAADFEGIAVAGQDVWLVTSEGKLYRAIDGLAGSRQPAYEVFTTRLKKRCEVEGLTFDSTQFLLACKENFGKEDRDRLMIYSWSPGASQAEVYLSRPLRELGSMHKLNPSGLAIAGSSIHIVAARQTTLLEIDRSGNLLGARTLVGHPQPEGIEVMPDGSIVIADEGKSGGGRLTRYAPVNDSD